MRVVVLTGAGRAFCTGVDLKALAGGRLGLDDLVAWEDVMTAIERMDKLFVAGIHGYCLGGGLQLTLVCDYRLATEDARLGLPAVKESLIPSLALYRLPRLIGAARATELILLADPITARDAERFGLVNRVVSAAEFPKALDAVVERFLALPETTTAARWRRSAGRTDTAEAAAGRVSRLPHAADPSQRGHLARAGAALGGADAPPWESLRQADLLDPQTARDTEKITAIRDRVGPPRARDRSAPPTDCRESSTSRPKSHSHSDPQSMLPSSAGPTLSNLFGRLSSKSRT